MSPSSQGPEWKNILSKKERQELEAMSDLAQGVVYTAIAKQGKPSAQVGMIDAGAPIQYSEFVALSSKSQSYNLYLGKVPKEGTNRQQEIEDLFQLAQKNAPFITKTVDVARNRVLQAPASTPT